MLVVGVMLDSPVADLEVAHRTLRDLAGDSLSGIPLVSRDEVPDDACVVLHDPGCPTVPPDFVARLVERCRSTGRPQVAVSPVTDTVKVVEGGRVGETLDRESLAVVASPVVLPPGMRLTSDDVVGILAELRSAGVVDLVVAPVEALRVSGPDDARLLEARLGA